MLNQINQKQCLFFHSVKGKMHEIHRRTISSKNEPPQVLPRVIFWILNWQNHKHKYSILFIVQIAVDQHGGPTIFHKHRFSFCKMQETRSPKIVKKKLYKILWLTDSTMFFLVNACPQEHSFASTVRTQPDYGGPTIFHKHRFSFCKMQETRSPKIVKKKLYKILWLTDSTMFFLVNACPQEHSFASTVRTQPGFWLYHGFVDR